MCRGWEKDNSIGDKNIKKLLSNKDKRDIKELHGEFGKNILMQGERNKNKETVEYEIDLPL
jgi:hypothetical protein